MTVIQHLFAMLGPMLIIANVALTVGRTRVRSRSVLAALGLASAGLSLIPFGQASVAGWLLGITDPLSMTTLAILLYGAAQALGYSCMPDVNVRLLDFGLTAVVVVVAAISLYSASLGALPIDVYAAGYGGANLPLVLGALIGYSAWRGLIVTPGLIALALATWLLQMSESTNLWDYLIDPLTPALATGVALQRLRRGMTLEKAA